MTVLTPRPYQQRMIQYLRKQKRAMDYDKPGLGKTLCAAEASEGRTLVLTPTYWVDHWGEFLREQYGHVRGRNRVAVATMGASWQRKLFEIGGPCDWAVTNIDSVTTLPLHGFKWDTIIIDESHHFRGHNTQRGRAALALCKAASRVYLLSATPIYTEPDDLFGQLRLLAPETFTSYHQFIKRYCKTIDSQWGTKVIGARDANEIRSLLSRYGLGRTYQDVSMELPQLIAQKVTIPFTDTEKKRYLECKLQYRLDGKPLENAAQVLRYLKALTITPAKVEALKDIVKSSNGGGTAIFTWYRETAEMLGSTFGVPAITGDLAPRLRAVKAADGGKIVVATIASLGEGVDLSHLSNVVFMEEPYEYGRFDQALARVRRFRPSGEVRPVHVYYLHVKGTVDEVVHKVLSRRVHWDMSRIAQEALA